MKPRLPKSLPIRAFVDGFPSFDHCMAEAGLFRPWFSQPNGDSWNGWRGLLKAANGLPLSAAEHDFFKLVAGDREPPRRRVKELWVVAGRRSGKDSIASALAAHAAAEFVPTSLRPGERAAAIIVACDRDQAKICWRYIFSYFQRIPALAQMIETARPSDGTLELSNQVDVIVVAGTRWAGRGRPVLISVLDEAAFYRDETSANPDTEIYNSLLPAMATIPNSMMIAISTPYRASGLLYSKWKANFGKTSDDILVLQAPSHLLNPSLDVSLRDRQMAEDPIVARCEWYADVWREDLSSYITRTEIEAIVDTGITVRPPQIGVQYFAHLDASSGSGRDSFCASIGHKDGDTCIVDCLIEIKPPFAPPIAVEQIAMTLRNYGITRANCDRWGLGFVESEFRRHGIELIYSDKTSSEIFRQALPVIRSGRARLVDNDRMVNQFANLERRVLPGGGERIGHPERGGGHHHDDVAVVTAGLLVALSQPLSGAEGWLEFMRGECIAAGVNPDFSMIDTDTDGIRPAGPNFGFNFSINEQLYRVFVPPVLAAGMSDIRFYEGQPCKSMTRTEAIEWLRRPSVAELNPDLVRDLGIEETTP